MTAKDLSEDDVALYDRQIRLWGLDAQKRMQSSKVLIINLDGMTTEVCKNLVLAGVGSIKIVDPRNVEEKHLATQFLFSPDSIGQNKADACLERLGLLNPRVEITTEKRAIEDLPEDFFSGFTLVFFAGGVKSQIIRVNTICRKLGVKFIASSMHGFFGLIFTDLLQHTYIEEKKKPVEGKKDEVETVVTQAVENFVPFEQALKKKWGTVPFKKQKRISPALFAFLVLFEFQEEVGRLPTSSEEDRKHFLEKRKTLFSALEIDERVLSDDYALSFLLHLGAEIAPVSAILGGIGAQEAIKVVSGKDLPVNNFFVFEGATGVGSVETLE